ncbi:MAG: hypothetical protein AAFP85_06830 [Pseudomonadota bacterium]
MTQQQPITRFDRMCDHLQHAQTLVRPDMPSQRGDLNLAKDGSQHRRYHGLYEDLLN